jgi:hypothetical protein
MIAKAPARYNAGLALIFDFLFFAGDADRLDAESALFAPDQAHPWPDPVYLSFF